jgi:hypothetical protein
LYLGRTVAAFLVVADGQTHGPFPAGAEPTALEITAQVLRFEVEASTGGNTGAVEIEVHADPRASIHPD